MHVKFWRTFTAHVVANVVFLSFSHSIRMISNLALSRKRLIYALKIRRAADIYSRRAFPFQWQARGSGSIPKECAIASRRSCRAHFRSRATNFCREFVSCFEPTYVTTAFKGTIRLTARSFLPARGTQRGESLGHSVGVSVIHDARPIKLAVHPIKISNRCVGR